MIATRSPGRIPHSTQRAGDVQARAPGGRPAPGRARRSAAGRDPRRARPRRRGRPGASWAHRGGLTDVHATTSQTASRGLAVSPGRQRVVSPLESVAVHASGLSAAVRPPRRRHGGRARAPRVVGPAAARRTALTSSTATTTHPSTTPGCARPRPSAQRLARPARRPAVRHAAAAHAPDRRAARRPPRARAGGRARAARGPPRGLGGAAQRPRRRRRRALAAIFAAERWDVIPNAESMDAFSDRVGRGMTQLVDTVGPDGVARRVRPRRRDRRGVPPDHRQPGLRVPLRRERLDHPARADGERPLGADQLQRHRAPPGPRRHVTTTIVTGLGFPESPRWHDDALWFVDVFRGAGHADRGFARDGDRGRDRRRRVGHGVPARRRAAGGEHAQAPRAAPGGPAARRRTPTSAR